MTGPRRPSRAVAGLVLLLVLVIAGATPRGTAAAFSDRAVVTSRTLAAATLAPVTDLTCTPGAAGLLQVTFAWTAQTDRSYAITVVNRTTGAVLRSATQTGASYTISGSLGQDGRYTIAVRSLYAPATAWASTAVTRNFSENTAGLAFTCE